MSWWNTSNFTDLATKAFKNAQKKIDKALDIGENEEHKKDESGATAENKSSGGKSVHWGAWNADDNSDAGKSVWSFPWVLGTDDNKEEEDKTEDARKSEVLNAAKERAKAKSELFPTKVSKSVIQGDVLQCENKVKKTELVEDKFQNEQKLETQDTEELEILDSQKHEAKFCSEREMFMADTVNNKIQSSVGFLVSEVADVSLKQDAAELKISVPAELTNANMQDSYEYKESVIASSGFQEIVDLELIKAVSKAEDDIKAEDIASPAHLTGLDSQTEIQKSISKYIYQDSAGVGDSEMITIIKESSSNVIEMNKKETPDLRNPQNNSPVTIAVTDSFKDTGYVSSSLEHVPQTDVRVSESEPDLRNEDSGDQVCSDPELINIEKRSSDDDYDDAGTTLKSHCDLKVSTHDVTVERSIGSHDIHNQKLNEEFGIRNHVIHEIENATNVIDYGANCDSIRIVTLEESELGVKADLDIPYSLTSCVSSDSESSVNKLDVSLETCTSEETVIDQNKFQADIDEKVDHPEPNQSTFGDMESVKTDSNYEVMKANLLHEKLYSHKVIDECVSGEFTADLSPAHSFVKCMLEDVIDEGKQYDSNSDSHSATEKSDGSRSIYSNHESGDEIDTTTSSDIEIISYPTSGEDNRQVSPVDPHPLRLALQKSAWIVSPTHRRSDSSDSSSTSKDGGYSEHIPGRECPDYIEYQQAQSEQCEGQKPELPVLNEEDDDMHHPQRLVKDPSDQSVNLALLHDPGQMLHKQPADLEQKMTELTEIIHVREQKVFQLSQENCNLTEINNVLRNQIKQLEDAQEAKLADINELTAEFTKRLTDAEKRVSTAIREKEVLKSQLQEAQNELLKRAGDNSLKQILKEKEQQIAELLQEGEKLSKSQLQNNTVIKKLRQKEKDNESTITTQKKKLDAQTEELEHLHIVLESKEELEAKQSEIISKLNSALKKQEQEMIRLKSEHEDAVEKARGLQVALDNSYREMTELHKNSAVQDSKAQEAALSAEMQVREELKMIIEKQQQQFKWEKEALVMQIEDLRMSIGRMEKDYNRREEMFRQEISDLHKQLREDEARTQELTQGVSLATRPLLRQIENLQSTFNAQSSTWEKVERNLSDRLSEAQNQLAIISEKERTANEQVMEYGTKVTSLESQISRLKQERSQLTAQMEMLKAKVEFSEDAKHTEVAQMEVMKQQLVLETQEAKKQKVLLETQLDVEKSKVEQERKKVALLQDQIKDLDRELQKSRAPKDIPVYPATPSPVSVSRQDSIAGSLHEHSFTAITQEELERNFMLPPPNGNRQSLYEVLRQSGAANLLDNLQSQLKMREGEIAHLQTEIRSLERTRESMARELVILSNRNDDLEEKVKDLPFLTEKYKDLDQRYNALLQMYGEKVEEAEELKMDLQDVKDVYKTQIDHLLT